MQQLRVLELPSKSRLFRYRRFRSSYNLAVYRGISRIAIMRSVVMVVQLHMRINCLWADGARDPNGLWALGLGFGVYQSLSLELTHRTKKYRTSTS